MTKLTVSNIGITYTWKITRKCERTVAPIARAFGLGVPDFLIQLTKHTLPNQPPPVRDVQAAPEQVPAGFSVIQPTDVAIRQRVEAAATHDGVSPELFVWQCVYSSLEAVEESIILDPASGRPIGSKPILEEFCTRVGPEHVGSWNEDSDRQNRHTARTNLAATRDDAPTPAIQQAIDTVLEWLGDETRRMDQDLNPSGGDATSFRVLA